MTDKVEIKEKSAESKAESAGVEYSIPYIVETKEKNAEAKAESAGVEYSIPYILAQIARLQGQTEYLNEALMHLAEMTDGDSGGPGCPGNIQAQAKAQAYGDIVKCRETTNQQILRLYEKMYDDLKPTDYSAKMFDTLNHTISSAAKGEYSTEALDEILDGLRQIFKENFSKENR